MVTRCFALLVTVAAAIFASEGSAQQLNLDAAKPEATLKTIMERMKAAQQLSNASVQAISLRRSEGFDPERRKTDIRTTVKATWRYSGPGKLRSEARVTSTETMEDGSVESRVSRLITVYDRKLGESKSVNIKDDIPPREMRGRYYAYPDTCPLEVAFIGMPFNQNLIDDRSTIESSEIIGRPAIIVSTAILEAKDSDMYQKFAIDSERCTVLQFQHFARAGKDKPWLLVRNLECFDFKLDDASQIWVPSSAKYKIWNFDSKLGVTRFSSESQMVFSNWVFNEKFDEKLFSLDEPLIQADDAGQAN